MDYDKKVNKIMSSDESKKMIRILIVKSWNQSIINKNTKINEKDLSDILKDAHVIFSDLLLNYINENSVGIDFDITSLAEYIMNQSYNEWLHKLISYSVNNNYTLNVDDVIEDSFPSNKWFEVDFN